MPPVTRRNTQFTLRSTHRVSQLLTGRGTISVPMTLAHAVSTSAAPTAAATQRAASGTTMGSPRDESGAMPNLLRPGRPRDPEAADRRVKPRRASREAGPVGALG